jgi:dGTP triphosphohydrolase
MGSQFHDIIPGTSTPKAYEYAWNDQILALNQFASVLTSATESVVSGMNTETKGTAIVVYNPLSIAREDGLSRAAADYVSGMTDKYAMSQYSELFIPEAWQVK